VAATATGTGTGAQIKFFKAGNENNFFKLESLSREKA
jgi:hypothetical protein